MVAAGRPARWRQRGVARIVRVTTRIGFLQALEVTLPESLLRRTEFVEVLPGIDAARVAIGEHRLHRVVADRLELRNGHIALADLQRLLARAMPLHFGRRREHAQELEWQAKHLAIRKCNLE